MNAGSLLLIAAAIFFFLAAVGATVLPNPTAWGLFFLALGILCSGIPITWWQRKP